MPLAMAKPRLRAIFFRTASVLVVAAALAAGLGSCRGPAGRGGTGGAGSGPGGAAPGVAGSAGAETAAQAVAETAAERGQHLALLHSNNVEGEYENCGCPSHPLGGLARRATVIDQARTEADGVLVVDAGDLLLPAPLPGRKEEKKGPGLIRDANPSEVERRARLVLAAFARMGIAAFLPAERDLAVGPEKLKKWLKAEGVPAVASNVVDRAGRPIFDKDRLVTVADLRVGIFGVVSPQPEDAALWKSWRLRATPAESAAREEVASLRARGAEIVVALLHVGPLDAANQLLQAVPGVDFAVQGHVGSQLQPPAIVGTARMVDTMSTGKFAGRLDIHVVNGQTGTWKDRGERAQLLAIAADHRQQLADLDRRARADTGGQLADFYRQRREAIGRALEAELAEARKLPTRVEGSWYEGRVVPLDESIPDQSGVTLLVAAYNAESARRTAAKRPVGITGGSASSAPLPGSRPSDAGQEKPTRYAGSAACARCHPQEAAQFETTPHAHSLAALANIKGGARDRDPTCVGCHTTGFMQPGGTWSVAVAVARLPNVGCESCHGPSLGHISLDDKKGTTRRRVPETVCRGCHTPDRTSRAFDFPAATKMILGPGHGGA